MYRSPTKQTFMHEGKTVKKNKNSVTNSHILRCFEHAVLTVYSSKFTLIN